MYKIIYDFDNGQDTTRGIIETRNSYKEAIKLVNELKESPCYCNIQLIELDY